MKEELPPERESRLKAFLAGVLAYGALTARRAHRRGTLHVEAQSAASGRPRPPYSYFPALASIRYW